MLYELMVTLAVFVGLFGLWVMKKDSDDSFNNGSFDTTSGGRALKKIASKILNMDMIKGGYKAYKKIKA